jgi:nicotinamide mononucleotide transporter
MHFSALEATATLCALSYLYFIMRKKSVGWIFGAVAALLYVVVMYQQGLWLQTMLQVFYFFTTLYGFWHWKTQQEEGIFRIHRMSLKKHVWVVGGVVLATLLVGRLAYGLSPEPLSPALYYLDAFIALGSMVTTWMVARCYLENWLYWVVLDTLAASLYYNQGLTLTSGLFVLYTGLSVVGYRKWVGYQDEASRLSLA